MKAIHVLFWLTLWRCTDALENGCHRLPVVRYAEILESSLKTNYTDGDLVHFTCFVGYVSRGEITYKCYDRRWRLTHHNKCSRNQCEIPEDIDNGEYSVVNGKGFVNGTVIKYTCNEGYMLVGGSTRLCMSEGWSDRVPSCEVVKCRPVQANGNLIACGNSKSPQYGDIIQFECLTDSMKMKGEKQIHCTDTGEWSASIPQCEVLKCRPVQANGNLIAWGNTKSPQYGDIIQFECRTDYMKMNGEKQIRCTDTGEWSASIPQCEVVKCTPVEATGHLIAWGNTKSPQYGDIIQFECQTVYIKIKGEKQIHCTDTGEWSASIPQCEVVNCTPVEATGDLIAWGNTKSPQHGDIIQFECRTVYMKMKGEKRIHCTDTGEWSASIPQCEVVKCTPVEATGNLIAWGNTKSPQYGDIIQFECRTVYMKMKGEKQINCTDTGEWSASIPRCEVVKCRPVQATGDLYAFGNTKSPQHGDIIQFECQKDYMKIKGEKQIHCTDAGEWSASIPQCEVVNCTPVEATGNLIAWGNTKSPQHGDIIQFECRTVYMKMKGEKQIHCTDAGEWSASIPRCEVVKCRPVQATGDLIACGNTKSPQYGDIIQFECQKDYMKIKGEKQIHCTDAGEWSASIPQCEDINADRKAVVRKTEMSEDMQRYAIDCATQAMEKFSSGTDITRYIQKEFDKKYNPYWHCIVGRTFAYSVRPNGQHYIYFYLGKYAILLFKSA